MSICCMLAAVASRVGSEIAGSAGDFYRLGETAMLKAAVTDLINARKLIDFVHEIVWATINLHQI